MEYICDFCAKLVSLSHFNVSYISSYNILQQTEKNGCNIDSDSAAHVAWTPATP